VAWGRRCAFSTMAQKPTRAHPTPNRAALAAALDSTAPQVAFEVGEVLPEEFEVLCHVLACVGPRATALRLNCDLFDCFGTPGHFSGRSLGHALVATPNLVELRYAKWSLMRCALCAVRVCVVCLSLCCAPCQPSL
jgi:hypothetical protein